MFTAAAQSQEAAKGVQKAVTKMHIPLFDEIDTKEDNRSIDEIIEQGALIDESKLPDASSVMTVFGGKK